MARRIEHPRVTDGSRWLGRRNGEYVVLQQVGISWESRQRPCAAYQMRVEETGEEIWVEDNLLYAEIIAKSLIAIGPHSKEDILSGKF